MGHESAFDFQPLPFHLVGGIIQPRFQLGQKVQQLVAQLFVGFGERAAESVEGVLPGGFAVCAGKFVDRFGLDEICLAVDKSPEAEFAGQGGRKALLLQDGQGSRHDGAGTVAEEFHGILAGKGAGRPEDGGEHFIDAFAAPGILEPAVDHAVARGRSEGLAGGKAPRAEFDCPRAGASDNREGRAARGSGEGGYGPPSVHIASCHWELER